MIACAARPTRWLGRNQSRARQHADESTPGGCPVHPRSGGHAAHAVASQTSGTPSSREKGSGYFINWFFGPCWTERKQGQATLLPCWNVNPFSVLTERESSPMLRSNGDRCRGHRKGLLCAVGTRRDSRSSRSTPQDSRHSTRHGPCRATLGPCERPGSAAARGTY